MVRCAINPFSEAGAGSQDTRTRALDQASRRGKQYQAGPRDGPAW